MATAREKISVAKPEVLRWARETGGYSVREVAQKTKQPEERIASWENGSDFPTLAQLRKLAQLFKRPLAALLLAQPPDEGPVLKDFRSKYGASESFSSSAILDIRIALRRRNIALELAEVLEKEIVTWSKKLTQRNNPELAAQTERSELGIDILSQLSWRDSFEGLRKWKLAIESRGILVFQTEGVELSNFRGLCIHANSFPIIILNSKDSVNGRIFTLFHEYCHLLLGPEAKKGSIKVDRNFNLHEGIEDFCNKFAAALLMPREQFLSVVFEEGINEDNLTSDSLTRLSNRFRVSKAAALIRLYNLTNISKQKFQKLYPNYLTIDNESTSSGPVKYFRRALNWNGFQYSSLVLEGYRERKISAADVSDYLNTKLKHISDIEQVLLSKT